MKKISQEDDLVLLKRFGELRHNNSNTIRGNLVWVICKITFSIMLLIFLMGLVKALGHTMLFFIIFIIVGIYYGIQRDYEYRAIKEELQRRGLI